MKDFGNTFPNRKGFSLIEVLIALMIFAVGILGIISLQGISIMSIDFSGNMGAARILVSDQLERLSNLDFANAALNNCTSGVPNYCHNDVGGGIDGTPIVNVDYMGLADGNGRFRREWNVQTVEANVKQITVLVRWTDVPGQVTNVQVRSFNRRVEMGTIKINPN